MLVMGGCRKQRARIKENGNQTTEGIRKGIARQPYMNVDMENINGMVRESMLLNGVEIWEVEAGGK
jgi:hypothetical protein